MAFMRHCVSVVSVQFALWNLTVRAMLESYLEFFFSSSEFLYKYMVFVKPKVFHPLL